MRNALALLATILLSLPAAAAGPGAHATEIPVASSHLRMGDILADLDAESAAIDLGPAPAASGSRVVDHEELVRAFREHGIEPPHVLPGAVRIVRKMRRLSPRDLGDLVRSGLQESLPRGATVADVHGTSTSVPDGWTRATCEVPRPPHKAGSITSSASLTFFEGEQALWRMSVPVDLALSSEVTAYDVARGGHLTLIIRRGLVEVSASGTAGADADVGDLVPVILLPSGRTLSARLEDKDHASLVGTP
jgi:Chaperone for flagella basal body P-ring formation